MSPVMMKKASKPLSLTFIIVAIAAFLAAPVLAEPEEDDELARAQAQMNAEVLSKPFLAEKPEEVDKYIKSMLEQNIKPEEYKGRYWRKGYTCRDLLRYNWTEYRNCQYYYRYHGRYYY
ncbi:hypothetical protein SAMN06297280_1356 [Arsukibacterium tuosuense]|uniref:Uncharacterized protein n=1 Tax=Arsukibacterium tuosuense TaxID=1323745 RepID=A0A285IMX6_9GAMM|nr:hypothetical protein [Arsukibacterium tuosuense]SNY49328.1 hypothetical protein SAMN06297280_1356 [Arsukibacterium tuosuense]